jgi:tetratricopeptide (TPR) repeat protein
MKISEVELKELNKFGVSQAAELHYVSSALAFYGLYFGTGDPIYLLQAAVNLRLAGEYVKADTVFAEILERFGESYKVCMEAGLCKLEIHRYDEAYKLFKAAYERERTAHAAIHCGLALRRSNSFRPAIAYQEAALSLDPNNVSAKIEMASCYESLEEYPKAIAVYESVLDGSTSQTFVYNRLGICYEKIGDKVALSKLLESDSYYKCMDTSYSVISTLLWSLRMNKDLDDASILSAVPRLISDPAHKRIIDCLTLHMSIRIKQSNQYYSEYRKIFMADEYGADALRITEEHPIDAVVEKISNCHFEEVDATIDTICNEMDRGNPFCLIRLGDGEGNFLSPIVVPNSQFLEEQNRMILRNWFGQNLKPPEAYTRLSDDFLAAVSDADVLGVPNAARIKYESANEPRGYWGVYFASHYACTMIKKRKFVSPNIHLHLFRNEKFLAALRRSKTINTISCHGEFGRRLRNKFHVTGGIDLIVPGEMGSPAIPSSSKLGEHYPSTYALIVQQISQFEPGSVVLVAAGACGKVYSHVAKRAGCFGIDIGAIADYLMGLNTRRIFGTESFQMDHQKFESNGRVVA